MNFRRGSSIVTLALLIVFTAASAFAGVPLVTSYQGRLLDASDQPLTGSYTMVFQIFDAPVGGNPLWTEDHVGVQVADGLFSVALGATVPLSAELLAGNGGGGGGGAVRYLQIQVAGSPPISPRTPLSSAPYSVASGSVSGDVVTAPGELHLFDADSASTIDMGTKLIAGKKVAKFKAGAELAGSVNRREVAVSAGDDSASIAIDEPGVHRMMISSSGGNGGGSGGQVSLRLSNMCCLGSSGEDGVGLVSDESSNSISVVRLNGLPPGTPVTGRVVISAANDSGSVVVGDPNIASVVSSVGNLAGGAGGGAAAASYAATGRMTPSGLDQVMTRVDDSGPSIAIDESGVHVARIAADDDSTYMEFKGTRPGRPQYGNIAMVAGGDESRVLMVTDADGDGVAEGSVLSSSSTTSSRLAIKTKGTSAQREIRHNTDSLIAESSVAADLDGDGLEDLVVVSSTDATSAKHAINTKGTGANTGKTASLTMQATPGGSASVSSELDSDGDGIPDKEITQLLTPITSGMAIKTKGTGAEKNRTATISSGTGVGSASTYVDIDDDGDGVPESEISHSVTPTTSSVAIKTKGTGADANRVISTTTPDSVVTDLTYEFTNSLLMPALMKAKEKANRTKCSNNLRYQSPVATNDAELAVDSAGSGLTMTADSDGDGVPEAKISGKIIGGQFTGGPGTLSLQLADVDDDGVPESEISQTVLPATSSVAIKTKGTGAEANRIIGATDDTSAAVLLATDDASITMKVRKGGVVTGSIIVTNGSAMRMVDFGSDGNGYFATGVGVGVDPTHAVDVAGGAYCDGTNWVNASDANVKENFQPINGSELLAQIDQLAISKWNYKGNTDMEHIGPTAQDFQAAFGVGSDGKSISTIDPAGIALAATKELSARLNKKTERIDQLENEVQQLRALVEKLLSEKK
jgi:hypothetical protein